MYNHQNVIWGEFQFIMVGYDRARHEAALEEITKLIKSVDYKNSAISIDLDDQTEWENSEDIAQQLDTHISEVLKTLLPTSSIAGAYAQQFHGNVCVPDMDREMKRRRLFLERVLDNVKAHPVIYFTLRSIAISGAQLELTNIMYFSANAEEMDYVRLDEEIRNLQEEFSKARYRDQLRIHTSLATQLTNIPHKLIEANADIVHFSSHGTEGGIYVRDADDTGVLVETTQLLELFKAMDKLPKLVFLSACYSKSIAESLSDIIDCCIGMDGEVDDLTANEFAKHFYRALAGGSSVQAAFDTGVLNVKNSGCQEEAAKYCLFGQPDHARSLIFCGDKAATKTDLLKVGWRRAATMGIPIREYQLVFYIQNTGTVAVNDFRVCLFKSDTLDVAKLATENEHHSRRPHGFELTNVRPAFVCVNKAGELVYPDQQFDFASFFYKDISDPDQRITAEYRIDSSAGTFVGTLDFSVQEIINFGH